MSQFKISRRHFITASGAIFTLPLLESLFPLSKALAADANDPRRYVGIYFPNGTYNRPDKPLWATQPGALSAANTSLVFSPFTANYADIINLNNMRNDAYDRLRGDEHENQAQTFLTCDSNIGAATNSFEHVIADKVGKAALVLSAGPTNTDLERDKYVSYRNGVGNVGISNPGDLYRSLFSKIVPSTGNTTPTANNNKSILDSSIADFNALKGTLSKSDRLKMDEFQTSIRDLESKVASTTPTAPPVTACASPALDPNVDSSDSKSPALYLPKLFALNDMIKIAFACDLTRSVSIMADQETTGRAYAQTPAGLVYQNGDINGVGGCHITISHGIETPLGYNRAVTRDRVYMAFVLDLANKLKASVDPSGSRMLDNTIIQAGFGVMDGNHNYYDNQRPLVLVGGKNMVSPGMSYSMRANFYKDLYYTIATKMGVGLPNFQGSTTLLKL